MYPHNGFAIDRLFPTGTGDIWCAEFSFTSPDDEIDGADVAHNMRIKVRFSFPSDGLVSGLLNTAHEQVRAKLAEFSERANERSVQQLMQDARDRDIAMTSF